ncbi:MAG: acetyl-CoA carboxylase biotin carboxylase subunit [Planctomycetota bacterium]
MFNRILIANRGEVALRVIRACQELGVETVTVYSEADRDAIYLKQGSEGICIGAGDPAQSYLNIPAIISAAEISDVDAIHPGYGFLAEDPHFAEICESHQIKFIGPSPNTISTITDKAGAKKIAAGCDVSVVPGSSDVLKDEDEAIAAARDVGYPVVIKAQAAGSGKGLKVAHNEISLVNSFFTARSEAETLYGNGAVYLEKYLEKPRKIEFQLLADEHGNIIHLGERDCSLQRQHTKLIEETPSPVIDEKLRHEMGEAAKRIAQAVELRSVGTVQFLLDKARNYYFMEMTGRLQFEHPITEMVTNIDLVKEQIRIAAGERLRWRQEEVHLSGVAIECRINAEDPENDFKPCLGKIAEYYPPGGRGVRIDSHIYAGYDLPGGYDPLPGKLIVHANNRSTAILRMRRALGEFVIDGVKTIIPLYKKIFGHMRYKGGDIDTMFIDEYFGT